MDDDINLDEIEKKAYRSQFEDGLTDMLISFLFISLAIGQVGTLFGEPETLYFLALYGMSYIIGVFIVRFLKKHYVIPRVGKAKFGVKRKRRKIWLALILMFFFIVTLLVYLTNIPGFPIQINIPIEGFSVILLIGTVFMFMPMTLLAYFLDFSRMYIIAVMGFIGIIFIEVLNPFFEDSFHFIIILGIIGIIILSWSLVIFYRFLKKHPIQDIDKKQEDNKVD